MLFVCFILCSFFPLLWLWRSLEPIKQDKESAGAKWAQKQQQELEEKNRRSVCFVSFFFFLSFALIEQQHRREAERAQEIAEARDNYFNSLIESKMTAAEKESLWLAEKKRLEDIDKHRLDYSFVCWNNSSLF